MSGTALNDQLAKALARQGTTIFNNAREALAHRDLTALAEQARALQVAAQATGETLISAQAKLLEQAAQRGQLQQATKILTTIKEAILNLRHPQSTPQQHLPKTTVPPHVPSQTQPKTQSPAAPHRDENYLKRLGNYLVEAELVTPAQIEVALADQRATGSRLGDILVARGWVKPGTIEFIMEKVVVPERTGHRSAPPAQAPAKRTMPANNMNLDRATFIDQSSPSFVTDDFRY